MPDAPEDRLRRELLPTLAHELRTPLNAIIGFTELIHKGKVGAILPAQEEYMGDVLTSARALLRLLNDLLDLAKSEPIPDAPLADVVLADAIAEVVQIVRGQATQHGHRIAVTVDPAIGTIVADPVRLKRILYELVASAARMADEGTPIDIAATLVDAERFRIDVDEMFSAVLPLRSHART